MVEGRVGDGQGLRYGSPPRETCSNYDQTETRIVAAPECAFS